MTSSVRTAGLVILAVSLLAAPLLTAPRDAGQGGPGGIGGGGQSGGRGGAGGGSGGEDEGFGNNLGTPAVFAEGYGMGGLPILLAWPTLDQNTGLRPVASDPYAAQLEYWDAAAIYLLNGVPYYPQQTTSHWQAQWRAGTAGAPEDVTLNWSDNLTKQSWTARSAIRVEHVLYQKPTTSMTSYVMAYLFGKRTSEVWGASSAQAPVNYNTVYSVTARLKIEKLTGEFGGVDTTVPGVNLAVYEGFGVDGPGAYSAEINVSGNLVYGYNWMLSQMPLTTAQKVGWWQITFQLDPSAAYTIAPEGVPPQSYNVVRNAQFASLDAGDLGDDVLFKPTLPDPHTSVLKVEITDRRVSKKPSNPGSGGRGTTGKSGKK